MVADHTKQAGKSSALMEFLHKTGSAECMRLGYRRQIVRSGGTLVVAIGWNWEQNHMRKTVKLAHLPGTVCPGKHEVIERVR